MKCLNLRLWGAAGLMAGSLAACGGGGGGGGSPAEAGARAQPQSVGVAAGGLAPGASIHVLWIGNSLTNTPGEYPYTEGPMPERLKPMLAELGITMTYQARLRGGAEFSGHAANPDVMAEIANPAYDAVNLQGYYEGFSSAAAYQAAVKPLYQAARAAGSELLFEAGWPYNDPGFPAYPAAANAVEGAAAVMPGAHPVQVARVWEAVRLANPALYRRLYLDPTWTSDGTHQGKVGDYLNALTYARFFSGRSVQGVTSIPQPVRSALTPAELQTLKTAVDGAVTVFYRSPALPASLKLSLSGISDGQVVVEGTGLQLSAVATDSSGADASARVAWLNGAGVVLHRGGTFGWTPPAGSQVITARVAGADGKTVEVSRRFTVTAAQAPLPPQARDLAVNVTQHANFRQVDLTGSVQAMSRPVAWTSLQLDLSQFKGRAAAPSTADSSTVNLDYANGYVGADLIRWRVQDDAGRWSNWAAMNITVVPAPAPTGLTISVVKATRSGYQAAYRLATNVAARCRAAWTPGYAYGALYDNLAHDATGRVHDKSAMLGMPVSQTVHAVCRAEVGGAERQIAIRLP